MASSGQFNMVAEEGNKRKGSMGNAELRQCVLGRVTILFLFFLIKKSILYFLIPKIKNFI